MHDIEENGRLETMFQLNVKGNAPSVNIQGIITAIPDGTASKNQTIDFLSLYTYKAGSMDFVEILPIRVNNGVSTVHLFAVNDEITLEYNDRVLLHFTPDDHYLIRDLQAAGQYVRDTAIVNIIDNDSKLYVIINFV